MKFYHIYIIITKRIDENHNCSKQQEKKKEYKTEKEIFFEQLETDTHTNTHTHEANLSKFPLIFRSRLECNDANVHKIHNENSRTR